MLFLENKKILFFAPKFHNLHEKIIKELENQGGIVDYFDERPSNSFFMKVLIRLKLKEIINNKIQKYYDEILNNTKANAYDYVFIVNMEAMPENILNKLKQQQSKATFILYMWDSLELKKVNKKQLDIFDKKFTFDPYDAEKRGLQHLDLFYSNEYQCEEKKNMIYDLCFIGTVHGDRYMILKEIERQAEKLNLKIYYHLYMPSKTLFWLRKLLDKQFRKASYTEIKFNSLNAEKIVKIMSQSNTIIDLSYKNQKGLSMRTFETLGCRKKLITTHEVVKNYDFYCATNINIINKDNIYIDLNFIQKNYKKLQNNIYLKYSLNKWIENIFS